MKRSYGAITAIAVLAAAGIIWKMTGTAPPADTATPSVQVSAIQLTSGTLPATLAAYGSIGAGAGAETTMTVASGGIVAAMPVIQGQAVTPGQTLAVIAPDPQSKSDLQKAENALNAARANHAHVAALLASHLATTADLAAAQQALSDATNTLTALQASGTGTTRTLTATSAGIVSAVLASPGALLPAGTALLRIIDTDALVANIGMAPADASAVQPGDAAMVKMLDSGTNIPGKVLQATAMPDSQTGLINVVLSLQGAATPGASVKAVITTATLTGYVVPRDSVQTDDKGDYGYQIDGKNIAHRVTVHVLGHAGENVIIAPDLDTTMKFVTAGAYQLDDGALVRLNTQAGATN
jgi:RND family efflux transporter MFP subunit